VQIDIGGDTVASRDARHLPHVGNTGFPAQFRNTLSHQIVSMRECRWTKLRGMVQPVIQRLTTLRAFGVISGAAEVRSGTERLNDISIEKAAAYETR
jgi:hypothetical protein